jgi:hypothetical protein
VISGIGTANIIASAMTTDKVAVVIDDLSQLSSIKNNTLVELSDVNFVVPLGTLYNLTKNGFNCDVLVRDKLGNTFTIRTKDTYTDRHSMNITNGTFNVTGLVDCSDSKMSVLRLRSASDIVKLPNILYSPINEWYGDKDMITTTSWKVATGDGSATATFGVPISSSDKKSSFALKDCSQAYAIENTYWGPSLKSWNGDTQCYKFTVSTQSATGDIYLSIWSLSYSSSFRDMKVEWAESEDATVWNDCHVTLEQHNSALGVSNEYPLGIYSVKAVGAQGHPKVCFKLSKASTKRADNTTNAISSSGPNYICYFGVYELKSEIND